MMNVFVAILCTIAIAALSFHFGTEWNTFDAGYQRCIARGGERYHKHVCSRTKIEYIDIDGHDQ